MAPRKPAVSTLLAQPARGNGSRPLSFIGALGFRRRRKENVVKFDDIGGSSASKAPSPREKNADGSTDSPMSAGTDATASGKHEHSPGERPWQAVRSLNLAWVERLWVCLKAESMRASTAARAQDRSAERGLLTREISSAYSTTSTGSMGPTTTGASNYGGASHALGSLTLPDFLALSRKLARRQHAEDQHLLECLFRRTDLRQTGVVRATDLATVLVLVCGEDAVSKLRALFRIFDSDDDNCLLLDEIFDMYVSIKTNDVSQHRHTLAADLATDGELSLQEAKRLFELTMEHLCTDSECVIFDEFVQAFDSCPYVLQSLMPGCFSLQWILENQALPMEDQIVPDSFGDIRIKNFVTAVRKGDEDVDMSRKHGRGRRILENCLGLSASAPVKERARRHDTVFKPGSASSTSESTSRRFTPRGSVHHSRSVVATSISAPDPHGHGVGEEVVLQRPRSAAATAGRGGVRKVKRNSVSPQRALDNASHGEVATITSVSSNDFLEDATESLTCWSENGDAHSNSSSVDQSPYNLPGTLSVVSNNIAVAIEEATVEALHVQKIPVQRLNETSMAVTRIASAASQKARQRASAKLAIFHGTDFQCALCGMTHELKSKRNKSSRTAVSHCSMYDSTHGDEDVPYENRTSTGD